MNTVEVLAAAREKLCQGWTQDVPARNSSGYPVNSKSQDAVCWCLYGAASAASDTDIDFSLAVEYLEKVLKKSEHNYVSFFNDAPGRTIEQVLELVDKAIALAKEPIE